jgi:alpha-tubulin suppressor-like RCC1 family protein
MHIKSKMMALAVALISLSLSAWAVPTKVTGGQFHSLIVSNGNVFAMGDNAEGAVAISAGPTQLTPLYTGIKGAKAVVTTDKRSAVLKDNGTAWWWGRQKTTFQPQYAPIKVPFAGVITDLALTFENLYFVSGGDVYVWDTASAAPSKIAGVTGVTQIAAGNKHLVMLTAGGDVLTLGSNQYGQLGDGTNNDSATPVATSIHSATSIAAGYGSTFAVLVDGSVAAVGMNDQGQLGIGTDSRTVGITNSGHTNLPGAVVGLTNVKYIASGLYQTIAVTNAGEVYVWGWHNFIGAGTYNFCNKPYKMAALAGVAEVGAGGDQTMFIDGTNTIKDWGGNTSGKLGVGDMIETHGPKAVALPPVDAAANDPTYEAPPVIAAVAPAAPVVPVPVVEPVIVAVVPAPEPAPVVVPTAIDTVIAAVVDVITPVVTVVQQVVAPIVTAVQQVIAPVVAPVINYCNKHVVNPVVKYVNSKIHDDNGHGNDVGKFDPSNPGKSKLVERAAYALAAEMPNLPTAAPRSVVPQSSKEKDDNGHGNDVGKVDPSNPGKSKESEVTHEDDGFTMTTKVDAKGKKTIVVSNTH